ncbi:MAG: glycosyltransferase family 4 protein [bacterium]
MTSGRPRLLVVWHGALFPEYRKPFDLLHRSHFDVSLLVPDRWRQTLVAEQEYVPNTNESFTTYVKRVRCPNAAVLHWYPELVTVLEDASPDILLAIEEPYSLLTARLLLWCRRRRIPFLFHTYQDLYKRYPPPFCWTQRYVLNGSQAVLAANRTVEQVLRMKNFAGPVVLYPYGIDPARFSPAETPRSGPLRIGYVGRFVPEKGVDLLVEAAKSLPPEVRIVLVGDGPERNRIMAHAKSCNVTYRIEWKGAAIHDQLPDICRELDILVLPSRTTKSWQEQFGRVLVEAMACGVVVVGSTCGAIPEVIGDAGLTFPENDSTELASCLNRLIESPSLRNSLIERGRERVLAMYTHQRCAEILYNALQMAMEPPAG